MARRLPDGEEDRTWKRSRVAPTISWRIGSFTNCQETMQSCGVLAWSGGFHTFGMGVSRPRSSRPNTTTPQFCMVSESIRTENYARVAAACALDNPGMSTGWMGTVAGAGGDC